MACRYTKSACQRSWRRYGSDASQLGIESVWERLARGSWPGRFLVRVELPGSVTARLGVDHIANVSRSASNRNIFMQPACTSCVYQTHPLVVYETHERPHSDSPRSNLQTLGPTRER